MSRQPPRNDAWPPAAGDTQSSLRLSDAGDRNSEAGKARQASPAASTDRLFELAFAIYRSLLTCGDTRDRLAEGEEPGDVHHELARRSLLAARIFWAEARRELSGDRHC